MKPFSVETIKSKPISIETESIQVESKRVMARFPFGGFVYQIPTAVYNLKTDERLPIIDVTRLSTLILYTVGFLASVLFWQQRRQRLT